VGLLVGLVGVRTVGDSVEINVGGIVMDTVGKDEADVGLVGTDVGIEEGVLEMGIAVGLVGINVGFREGKFEVGFADRACETGLRDGACEVGAADGFIGVADGIWDIEETRDTNINNDTIRIRPRQVIIDNL
jgi:hypothetical protein